MTLYTLSHTSNSIEVKKFSIVNVSMDSLIIISL